jgi:hypothetical protein
MNEDGSLNPKDGDAILLSNNSVDNVFAVAEKKPSRRNSSTITEQRRSHSKWISA